MPFPRSGALKSVANTKNTKCWLRLAVTPLRSSICALSFNTKATLGVETALCLCCRMVLLNELVVAVTKVDEGRIKTGRQLVSSLVATSAPQYYYLDVFLLHSLNRDYYHAFDDDR